MDRRYIEPRRPMWAVAEISWEDPTGTPYRAPATMEDTSASGACLRVPAPIGIGARLTVRWHREQFRAIARNCRVDGKEFLLGVRRDEAAVKNPAKNQSPIASTGNYITTRDLIAGAQRAPRQAATPTKSAPPAAAPEPVAAPPSNIPSSAHDGPTRASGPSSGHTAAAAPAGRLGNDRPSCPVPPPAPRSEPVSGRAPEPALAQASDRSPQSSAPPSQRRSPSQSPGSSTPQERKVMESKKLFPNFWRRQQ